MSQGVRRVPYGRRDRLSRNSTEGTLDICLEELVDSEVKSRERITSIEADLRAYRELAQVATSIFCEQNRDADEVAIL